MCVGCKSGRSLLRSLFTRETDHAEGTGRGDKTAREEEDEEDNSINTQREGTSVADD